MAQSSKEMVRLESAFWLATELSSYNLEYKVLRTLEIKNPKSLQYSFGPAS